jgi:hypothetical protein
MELIPKEIEATLPPLYSQENVSDPVAGRKTLRSLRQMHLLRSGGWAPDPSTSYLGEPKQNPGFHRGQTVEDGG